jgi:two-component system NtrC family response regulator
MNTVSILIIDDEQAICEGCRLVLSDQGYSVDCRMNGSEGLTAAREGKYDVVLLDMKLPDLNGMEILRTVRKEQPDMYIIVMTGFSSVQDAVKAIKLGAVDYIAKPFSDDELLIAVESAVKKKRLVEENLFLRRELLDQFGIDNIVGQNPKILKIFDRIKKVAPTGSTVLIYGESGTGKELFARAVHAHSPRAAKNFVAVDCSTLSPSLLESELFGHVKGAFTGAAQDKAGIFDIANEGTLFLDDIANLSMETQGKLLRVLEVYEYKPVGASHFKKTNVRIITATNKDLQTLVDEGNFREDLFYRLNVFPIFLPPLRERKDDITKLAYYFLRHFCSKTGKRITGFSDDALETLVNHKWPGNVRQLKNTIEHLVIEADGGVLENIDLLYTSPTKQFFGEDSSPETLEQLKAVKKQLLEEKYGHIEKTFLINALRASQGNITQAAEKVGMQRSNFSALLKKHRLSFKTTKHQPE